MTREYTMTIKVLVDDDTDEGPALDAACQATGAQERAGNRSGTDVRSRATWTTAGPTDPPVPE